MHNPKLRHRLHRIVAPTLLLRGESDGLVSADYVAGYAKLLPNAGVETIAAAGHLPQMEQPETFARTVLRFLEAV
jgi:pimeloyl-ACP methyl ester carboxylesterase